MNSVNRGQFGMCSSGSDLKGMQLIRFSALKCNPIVSVVRSASCSRGWLRLVVQMIFAAVTVTSFILIVLMAIPKEIKVPPPPVDYEPRCRVRHSCRVHCREALYDKQFEDDMVVAASEADENCNNIFLTLYKPMFINGELPRNWLSVMRTNIHELTIYGGNLKHIPPDAFMGAGSIKVLGFHNLEIHRWSTDSFVGLINLQRLDIKDCNNTLLPQSLLTAVHDTLGSLSITGSGQWNPINITGTNPYTKLEMVDFSNNFFTDVLGYFSFTRLQKCKVLCLNSCRITAIGAGAFNNLQSIEMLFLHNNYLVTIPPGLFNNIIQITTHKPRINLRDNLWHCECSADDIRELVTRDMLLSQPYCNSPEPVQFKSFSDFETYCTNNDSIMNNLDLKTTARTYEMYSNEETNILGLVYLARGCLSYNNTLQRIVSPIYGHHCLQLNVSRGFNSLPNVSAEPLQFDNKWVKFSYFLQTINFSMVQIDASKIYENYGLIWQQTSCPNDLYCVNDIPESLRIYNEDVNADYIFCPILHITRTIEYDKCVHYKAAMFEDDDLSNQVHIVFYIATAVVCLIFGAICVYAVIRKYPYLLKGNKRILFVKHIKTVDALVLPPKVPLRNDIVNITPSFNEKKVFTVRADHLPVNSFNRSKSMRSSKSSCPSYISALQPTEDQLAEWRIRHHFNNDLSFQSEFSTHSWISTDDTLYQSIDLDNDRT